MSYRDPVSSRALGLVDRELRNAARDGERLRQLRQQGRLTREEELRVKARYRGVCRKRLEAAMSGDAPRQEA